MFGSNNNDAPSGAKGVETLIARNTKVEGTVRFSGNLTIEGKISGDIIAESEKDCVVRITAEGKVNGEVRAPDVIINGHVTGDVYAEGQLILASKAMIDGNVNYRLIEVEKGAQINGKMVHMEKPMKSSESAKVTKAPDLEAKAT